MQKEQIFVFGQGKIVHAVLDQSKGHTVIVAGTQKHAELADFVCVNDPQQLDTIMALPERKALVLSPRKIYAKYAFFTGVECLPYFEDLAAYKWDPHAVSDQLCALALAAWMGANEVVMSGLQMQDKKEIDNVKALMTVYSGIDFIAVHKEPVKFGGIQLANFSTIDQPQYKQRIRSNA